MVTGNQLKTGYWRINPATGERDWIAQSNQPPTPDLEEEEVEIEEEEPISPLITSREFFEFDEAFAEAQARARAEQPTFDQLDLVQLEAVTPAPDVTELARLYGLPSNRFVGEVQLAQMRLPPEERTVQWRIPYEQYLNAEQAKFLGFDVPEGSVVKMTPMAGAEPSFFLLPMPEAEAEKVRPDEELVKHLRSVFPSMFDPANSYGYSLDEIPGVVVDQLRNRMATDYAGFVEELKARVDPQEAEDILRLFGVTEEHILQTLDFIDQEARVNTLITDVFPDFANAEELGGLVDSDFALFMETMQTGGGTPEKRRLLELMGFEPVEINEIFSRQRIVVEVDGIRQMLTIDIENQAAYNARGDYIGAFNAATKQFTKEPQQNIAKDFWDWTAFQSRTLWEQGENFMLSVMPEIIYAEIPENKADRDPVEKLFSEDMINSINENNRRMRENFRYLYGKNKEEYQQWVAKHPELVAPIAYQEGAFQHPELLKDYRYYAYELANIMPFIITATAMAVATGGVGLPAVIGTAAVMAPVEGQAVFEDLVNAGAPEDKAAELAAISGAIMGLLESAGRIPLLRQMSPLLFGQFKRKAISELSKRTLAETILKFGRNFTIVQFSEVATEVAQEVVSNVAVGFYDENRSILENLPDIAVKTAVATLLPSGLAAGVSVRMVSPLEQSGLSEIQKKARGWLKDEKGNWYEKLKEVARDERGSLRLVPEESEAELAKKREALLARERRGQDVSAEIFEVDQKIAALRGEPPIEGRVPITEPSQSQLLQSLIGATQAKSRETELLKTYSRETLDKAHEAGLVTRSPKGIYSITLKGRDFLKQEPVVPITEPGMPEAGLQVGMFGEEKIVRPPGRGKLVQISMEDQLKLKEYEDAAAAYEAEAEVAGLREFLVTDPVARKRIQIAGKKVGLEFFISLREQTFPEYFTVKQAEQLYPKHSFAKYAQKGLPTYNRVPKDEALDDLTKEFGLSPDEIAERVMRIREAKRKVKAVKVSAAEISRSVPEIKPKDIVLSPTGERMLTPAQRTRTLEVFGNYVMEPKRLMPGR